MPDEIRKVQPTEWERKYLGRWKVPEMFDMEKRKCLVEKFTQFEQITGPNMPQCVTISAETVRDVLDVLKEQEARVMTLEEIRERAEAIDPDPVFVEWGSGITAWIAQSVADIYSRIKVGDIRMRVWTSRPTEEQRKAVAWDE